jgi:hypothetical protein
MRRAIIVSATVGFIAGGTAIYGLLGAGSTAIYGLLDGYTPSPTSGPITAAVETSKSDRAGLFDGPDEEPRVRIGNLIILPPSEPDIVTGSVKPTAKPGQAAKKAKPRKPAPKQAQAQTQTQAQAANAAARKPAAQQQASAPSEADSKMMVLSGAE